MAKCSVSLYRIRDGNVSELADGSQRGGHKVGESETLEVNYPRIY